MKTFLLLTAVLLPVMTFSQSAAAESAIYDSAGKKIFSLLPTGEIEALGRNDAEKHRLYKLTDLETGATYTYSHRWDRTMSDGGVYMEYHFNKRQWYWVEEVPMKKTPLLADRVDKELIRRVYKADSNGMTVPEQGNYPILRFKDGNYIDEMGRPIYLQEGSFPRWCAIILLHKYYEQVYQTDAFDEIKAYREAETIRFAESNSLARDMLAQGNKNERSITTLLGKHYKMLYFTEIDGQLITPSKEQIKRLKNKWLIAKENTGRTSSGLVIPRAGFHLSKKEAKKRGFTEVASTDFVLEIKPSPEFLAEFQAAISQTVATTKEETPTEAAIQAEVDSLAVGILAGRLQRGSANGYRTAVTFEGPRDAAVDSHGNVFVVDGDAIRKITPDGRVSTFAGGTRGYVDGHGITARFSTPLGIAIDANDNLYVADSANQRIRKISPEGYVITLAGQSKGNQDGWGPNAKFNSPSGIAVDAQGNVYVSDDKNRKIRKVSPEGTVTTVGDEADIKFLRPRSLAVDQAGNVYVLDGAALKRIAPDESVFMMAPDMTFDAAADGTNRALFRDAGGIAIDSDGNLLLTKREDHEVIRIAPNGETTTVAQNNSEFWLGRPDAVAVGANGNIYLADSHNKVIHQVTPAGNTGPLPGMYIPEPEPIAPVVASNALSPEEAKALFAATKKNSKKDPEAMFELAKMYEERGSQSAYFMVSSYKKAAKSGHPGAQYELALRHLDGTIGYSLSITNGDVAAAERKQMAKRQVNAAKLFTQSANQGYALGQYALGKAYLNGEGVEQSTDTAIEWLSKAGAQGLFEAQIDLGEMYHKGIATPADPIMAIDWYTRAAAQGDWYSEAIKNGLLVQTDPNGAGQQISADGRAQADLAFSFYTGSGVEQNLAQAAGIFEESALLGNTTAQWMLGIMYLNGEGLDRNLERSIDWLTVASELNHPEAQFHLGFMYDRGYGLDRNTDLAYHWYSVSAEQGQVNAQFSLGDMYYRGDGRKADPKVARDWFELAADQGDAQAQYIAGDLYLDDSSNESHGARAIEMFEKAAAQGHIYAAGRLPEIKATDNVAAH